MRSRFITGIALLLAACGAVDAAFARDVDIAPLRAWNLPNYTLIAEDGFNPHDVVRSMTDAEFVLAKLLAREVKPFSTPLEVWLVPRNLWKRYLEPGDGIDGEYVPRRFSNYLIINADLPSGFENDGLRHEFSHYFLRAQVGGIYPLWFDEGLAVLVGNARIRGTRVTFKPVATPYLGPWVRMSRLFEIDKTSREYLERPTTQTVHYESYALVHRALIGDPAFGDHVFAYLSAVNRLVPAEDAAPGAFGMSFDDLDSNMREYLLKEDATVATLRIDPRPAGRLPAGRAMDSAQAALNLARLALDCGFKPEHTRELVDAARARAPLAPDVAVLELRLAVRDKEDEAALRLGASLEAGSDATLLRDAGVALFERVRKSDPLMSPAAHAKFEALAFTLLGRALQGSPGDAEAAWAYALLAVRLKTDMAPALEQLAAASGRMPGHPDLAEATARALEASGQEDAIMPHLADTLRNTSSPEQRAWAARRIRELRISEREKAPQ